MPKVLKYDKCEEIWSDIWDALTFNTVRLMQNSCHFADNSFKCILLNKNNCRINQISLKFVPCGLTDNKPVLVLIMTWCWMGDMLLSVIWTNDAFDYWHIYASLDLNKLNIPCYCHLLIEAHFNQGPCPGSTMTQALTHWLLRDVAVMPNVYTDWLFVHFQCNWHWENAKETHQWLVTIGPDTALVPPGMIWSCIIIVSWQCKV